MISQACRDAADAFSVKLAQVNNLKANGHTEIARGVLASAIRTAKTQHAQCEGCECQCEVERNG